MPPVTAKAPRAKPLDLELSPAHYLQILFLRKWIVAVVFAAVSLTTAFIAQRMPNIYTSETVILVDPQKVPESYIKPTVTGDVRNRLNTLTQQIMSATRLQKIIESFSLYGRDRKTMAREDVIAQMRKDVQVSLIGGGFAGDLQAFKVAYSGRDPRLVAQVANQLASLFIDENLKARELQATGTTEFLHNQLDEARKNLETQEARLRDFKLQHLGEMPESQVATLTILGQIKASLQQEGDALARAEQQRSYYQTLMAQSTTVVDVDDSTTVDGLKVEKTADGRLPAPPKPTELAVARAKLETLLTKYKESHPEVRRLRQQIADLEAKEASAPPVPKTEVASAKPEEPSVSLPPSARKRQPATLSSTNPVLVSQLQNVEAEIAKHKEEQSRLNRLMASYQSRLEAIPLREQQMTELVRDYEMSKLHYSQFLDKEMSAETATQLEIRQKGERFSILDPAQPAQRPSKPNRMLINLGGSFAGLILGVIVALGSEFFGMSITSPDHVPQLNGNQVLEVIPVIVTESDRKRKRKRTILAAGSGLAATAAAVAVLFYHYRG